MYKSVNRFLVVTVFFSLSVVLLAQGLDNPNTGALGTGKVLGTIEANTKVVEKPINLGFDKSDGFQSANKKLQNKRQQQDKEKALANKGIITPELLRKQTFQKNFEGNMMNFPQIDMDLGSFHTQSEYIFITSFDFGRFDGDKVQITVNGTRIHNNYLLTPSYKTIKIPLKIGLNKIEVTALNEGELSPNTGYFLFFDQQKQIIKEGKWMLAEGAKVIAIAVREEP